MIEQTPEGGYAPSAASENAPESFGQQIPFTPAAPLAERPVYSPYGEIIQLDWTPPSFGGLVIPEKSQAKIGLPFFKVRVIAAGPDVKIAKAGTWVLLPQQVILHAKWDAETVFFTSENKILATVS